jgi:outer membrane murein-binding lipoprotein Lpp
LEEIEMFAKKNIAIIGMVILSIIILTGCRNASPTTDPNLKITEIASTVQAELTKISALTPSATPTIDATATPKKKTKTPTPIGTLATAKPTKTPTPPGAATADDAKWIADVTIPDFSTLSPGQKFIKTWTIQNTGTTTWNKNYSLIYLEGLIGENNTISVKLTKDVLPGEQYDVSVNFVAPASNGLYPSYWKMYSASGYPFGEVLSMKFYVGIVPTATSTP